MANDFEQRKDSGRLNAVKSKNYPNSPDYWGELCINIKDMTNVTITPDGNYVFPISGWKKQSKAGNVYLSISVKRLRMDDTNQVKATVDLNDDDIPF